MANDNAELVRKVCYEEVVANLEVYDLYDHVLERTARCIKDYFEIGNKESIDKLTIEHLLIIAGHLGIKVYLATKDDFPDGVFAVLINVKVARNKIANAIFVREDLKETSAKFRIGHELGHYILGHRIIPMHQVASSFKEYRIYLANEYSANYFAGSMLMDPDKFRNECNKGKINIGKIARSFGVSYEQAAHRFITLINECAHFIKVDMEGAIQKRFSRLTDGIDWHRLEPVCEQWGARKIFAKEEGSILSQVTSLIDKNKNEVIQYFCFSRAATNENNNTFSITIGSTLDFAKRFEYFDMQTTEKIPVLAISSACVGVEDCPILEKCSKKKNDT